MAWMCEPALYCPGERVYRENNLPFMCLHLQHAGKLRNLVSFWRKAENSSAWIPVWFHQPQCAQKRFSSSSHLSKLPSQTLYSYIGHQPHWASFHSCPGLKPVSCLFWPMFFHITVYTMAFVFFCVFLFCYQHLNEAEFSLSNCDIFSKFTVLSQAPHLSLELLPNVSFAHRPKFMHLTLAF